MVGIAVNTVCVNGETKWAKLMGQTRFVLFHGRPYSDQHAQPMSKINYFLMDWTFNSKPENNPTCFRICAYKMCNKYVFFKLIYIFWFFFISCENKASNHDKCIEHIVSKQYIFRNIFWCLFLPKRNVIHNVIVCLMKRVYFKCTETTKVFWDKKQSYS